MNLKIQPIIIGTEYENPVRLSRHELITSYSNGWFSNNYLGYYLIKTVEKGNYQFKFSFREPLPNDGKLEMKIGPIGKKISIREDALYEIDFSEIFLPPGIHVFQAWFQNDKEVISPFYVHINKTENANN